MAAPMHSPHTGDIFTGGAWHPPLGRSVQRVINPATEEVIAEVALGDTRDLDRAVAAARAAFPDWSETSRQTRLDLLRSVLDIYTRRIGDFAAAITAELGAPRSLSEGAQAPAGVGHLRAVIEALEAFPFETRLPNGDLMLRDPVGVCGLITPWNWPINQIALKVAPALAAGCTMVLKPSELTPLSGLLYAEVLEEAGVPPGVFNLVNGTGPEIGAAMAAHPDIDMISFTGSTRAGKAVLRGGAETVKRVTLELGGKSANIIFADADLETAVASGVKTCFQNTGQSCDAPTRMLVERSAYDRVVALAAKAGSEATVGDPEQPGPHIGPLVSDLQFTRVQELISAGIAEGARLVTGGPGKPETCQRGYFVRPTIFADVTPDMRIAREEIFGPVLVILPFDTEAEAIALANDTPYGLASYLSTGDPDRVMRVARAMRAGTCNVNGAYFGAGSPFGGFKQSGLGREGGALGIEDFTEVKVLAI